MNAVVTQAIAGGFCDQKLLSYGYKLVMIDELFRKSSLPQIQNDEDKAHQRLCSLDSGQSFHQTSN